MKQQIIQLRKVFRYIIQAILLILAFLVVLFFSNYISQSFSLGFLIIFFFIFFAETRYLKFSNFFAKLLYNKLAKDKNSNYKLINLFFIVEDQLTEEDSVID